MYKSKNAIAKSSKTMYARMALQCLVQPMYKIKKGITIFVQKKEWIAISSRTYVQKQGWHCNILTVELKMGDVNNVRTMVKLMTITVYARPPSRLSSDEGKIKSAWPVGSKKCTSTLFLYIMPSPHTRTRQTMPPQLRPQPAWAKITTCPLLFWLFQFTMLHRVNTEWQRPIYSVHSIMSKNQSWLVGGWRVHAHLPTPFHFSYHHIQSCSVRSRYTHSLFHL